MCDCIVGLIYHVYRVNSPKQILFHGFHLYFRKPTSGVLMETGVADPYVYSMNHKKRGLFIIINNRRFNPKTKMGERTGTDLDAANLLQVFTGLGFKCHMFHDQTCQQMLDIMLEGE